MVFPTPVGVFPGGVALDGVIPGLPHARGGVSTPTPATMRVVQSSPRPWGCFQETPQEKPAEKVFPTPVGVFPPAQATASPPWSLPHARGGVSHAAMKAAHRVMSSPRPWGCFSKSSQKFCVLRVFPTPVGVFPTIRQENIT